MSEENRHHVGYHHGLLKSIKDDGENVLDGGNKKEYYEDSSENNKEEEKLHHKNIQHLSEAGAIAAGAFAMYGKHEAKEDPEHGHRHKLEEEIAAAATIGAGGFVFHEHHDKKEAKEQDEDSHGKKHHHIF